MSKSRILKIKIHVHVGDLKPLELLLFKSMRLLPLDIFCRGFDEVCLLGYENLLRNVKDTILAINLDTGLSLWVPPETTPQTCRIYQLSISAHSK